MKKISLFFKNTWVGIGCRLIVGGIFIYAGIPKAMNPPEFAQVVYNYQLIPDAWLSPVSLFLPWLEIYTGLSLILGVAMRGASLLISGMLAVFIAAISINLYRGVDVSCGCFTLSDEGASIGFDLIVRDILLLVCTAQVFFFPEKRFSLSHLKRLFFPSRQEK